jgi:hypothetical protein
VLPFIPLALSLAPQLLKSIFGDRGAAVSKNVAEAIQTVTNVNPTTPEGVAAAQAAIASNPELAAQLQQKLAEIAATREAEANREADASRQSDLEDLKVRVADIGNARQQTMTLASNHSPLALGAPILSGIILVAFGSVLLVMLTAQKTISHDVLPLANVMLGTLAAMSTQVANYWLGSSSGSATKNTMLADAQQKLWLSDAPETYRSRLSPSNTPGPLGSKAQTLTADDLNARSLEAAREGR